MNKRVAIVSGLRSPFCKANGVFNEIEADDLAANVLKELFTRAPFSPDIIDEVILGNVINGGNIARTAAVKAGLPEKIPAFTVDRNCASGLEAVVSGANRILQKQAEVVVAGGTESMSNTPVLFSREMKDYLLALSKAKSFKDKLFTLFRFRPSMLKPQIPDISDPLCGLTMGQTAENLVRDFKITREEQDLYALQSQLRAAKAAAEGKFKEEIVPIPLPPRYDKFQLADEGPRANQTLEALQKLKPVFEPITGSVTAGNSSPVTDGAVALFLMSEEKAKSLGLKPLGYITAFADVALDPTRMGMGPAYATAKLFKETGLTLKDIDLIEINEAFAAQIVALMKAFNSAEYAKNKLGLNAPLGELDPEKLNVNGGAIALGHPLGASGARLVLTLLLELKRRNKHRGLATLCVGGGQGQAAILEVE